MFKKTHKEVDEMQRREQQQREAAMDKRDTEDRKQDEKINNKERHDGCDGRGRRDGQSSACTATG